MVGVLVLGKNMIMRVSAGIALILAGVASGLLRPKPATDEPLRAKLGDNS